MVIARFQVGDADTAIGIRLQIFLQQFPCGGAQCEDGIRNQQFGIIAIGLDQFDRSGGQLVLRLDRNGGGRTQLDHEWDRRRIQIVAERCGCFDEAVGTRFQPIDEDFAVRIGDEAGMDRFAGSVLQGKDGVGQRLIFIVTVGFAQFDSSGDQMVHRSDCDGCDIVDRLGFGDCERKRGRIKIVAEWRCCFDEAIIARQQFFDVDFSILIGREIRLKDAPVGCLQFEDRSRQWGIGIVGIPLGQLDCAADPFVFGGQLQTLLLAAFDFENELFLR